jgi:uncharacterized protein
MSSPLHFRTTPLNLLVIQPTPFCNIDCGYCYLPGRSVAKRMRLETIERVFERLLADRLLPPRLSVLWHAGEPLTVPISFYESAFATIRSKCGTESHITHEMQTNATLIDERWCQFFRRHNVRG